MGLASAKDICKRDWSMESDRRLCRSKRLRLRVSRRMEHCQGRNSVAQVMDGRDEIVGDERGVAFVRAPDLVDGLAETLSHLHSRILRLGPVVGKGQIELQDLRGKGSAACDRTGIWRRGFGGIARDCAVASGTGKSGRAGADAAGLPGGPSFFAVGRAMAVHHQTVQRCVERALARGPLAALDDRPRPGREPQITAEAKTWVADLACRKAKDLGYPHELWTTRLLARHAREHGPARGIPALPNWLKARCATSSMSRR